MVEKLFRPRLTPAFRDYQRPLTTLPVSRAQCLKQVQFSNYICPRHDLKYDGCALMRAALTQKENMQSKP
jgi:hypothetical protein